MTHTTTVQDRADAGMIPLCPITYQEAMTLYAENGRKPFSFLTRPYGVVKTIVVESGHVLASPVEPAREHYDWITLQRSARGIR